MRIITEFLRLKYGVGLSWPLPDRTDEAVRLFPAKTLPLRFTARDYFQFHQALQRKGLALQLLWAE